MWATQAACLPMCKTLSKYLCNFMVDKYVYHRIALYTKWRVKTLCPSIEHKNNKKKQRKKWKAN